MGWFRKKLVRYAAVIALIGALASACKKEIPRDDAQELFSLVAQVEISLKKSKPDQEKIKKLVRLLARLKEEYSIKNIKVPENLSRAVYKLNDFYFNYELFVNEINRQANFAEVDPHFVTRLYLIDWLLETERILGFKLEAERTDLKNYFGKLIKLYEKSAQSQYRVEPSLAKFYEGMAEKIEKALEKLE